MTGDDHRRWQTCPNVAIADLNRAGLPAPLVVRLTEIVCIEPSRSDRRVGRAARKGSSGGF